MNASRGIETDTSESDTERLMRVRIEAFLELMQ